MEFPKCRLCGKQHRLGPCPDFAGSAKSSDGGGGANPLSRPKGTSDLSDGGRQEVGGSKVQPARKGGAEHQAVSNPRPSDRVPVRGQVENSARAGVASRPSGAKIKPGRPFDRDRKKTFEATKPWVSEGVSRATWYRNRKPKEDMA